MSRKNRLLFVAAFLLFASFARAEEIPVKEPITVNGDKVEYYHEKKQVVGSGNISIEYKEVILTCDKVTVYLDTREAIAEGNVKVKQKDGAYFTGEKINYNFDTQKGSVIQGYLNAVPFYGKADKVEKLGDKHFELEKGYVTTCNLEKPHYRVQAKQVRIYLDDKVVARNIKLYVGNVPIMYIPFYIQPLRETKKANITIVPGQSKDWGYYVLTGYRYRFSENFRGDLLLDYRTKKGLAEGINHYYGTDKLGKGSAKFYYTHENDGLAYEKTGETKSRYRFQFRHRWDMGPGTDTSAVAEINKLSDRDVIKDYFYKEYEELQDPNDYNYISVITTKPDYTSELLLRKRLDKFYTVVERLPEYSIDIKSHRMTKKYPVYYKGNASGVYLNKTYEKTDPEQKDVNTVRFDTYNQVSYPTRLFKFWNISPYIGTEQTYYSRNMWGDTNLVRGALIGGIDNQTKFYKVYDVETNVMGLDIHKLRHIITPSANYYYIHQPTISPDNLNQFDAIDALDTANGIKLSLENKLQTKRQQGDEMKSVDLATFIVSSDYMFRLKNDELALKSNKFKSVDFQLEAVPYPWLYTLSKMTVNTKKYLVETASVDIVGSGGDKWSLGVGYRYEDVESGFSNLVTLGGMYKINDMWRVRVYERFNLENGSFQEQEYTVYRDLHCWLAEFSYTVKDLKDHGIWFILRLKAFPEYPIGLRRTYYRPQFGATGN